MAESSNQLTVPALMAESMDKQLHEHGRALSDLRVQMAEVRKDVQVNAERQQELNGAVKSIAESMSKLAEVAVKTERLQEDHNLMAKTLHGPEGVKRAHDKLRDRVASLEWWVGAVKYVGGPALAAVLAKEALRLWGS